MAVAEIDGIDAGLGKTGAGLGLEWAELGRD